MHRWFYSYMIRRSWGAARARLVAYYSAKIWYLTSGISDLRLNCSFVQL